MAMGVSIDGPQLILRNHNQKNKWSMCPFSLIFYMFDYQTIYLLYIFSFFILYPFIFLGSCWALVLVWEWWRKFLIFILGIWKILERCMKKGLSNVSSHSWEKEIKTRKKIIPTKKNKMKAYKGVEDFVPYFWP